MNNAEFVTISGFEALERITGTITISRNTLLTTIPTFNALESAGVIAITMNGALRAILGFGALNSVTGNFLDITGNNSLSLCCGLLPIADGSLAVGSEIARNAAGCNGTGDITSTCSAALTIDEPADVTVALATLVRITGDLSITGALTSFPNFAALEVVEGSITISGLSDASLAALTDIFPVLAEVTGDLLIQDNTHVESITGFGVIGSIGGNFTVSGNTNLATCCDLRPAIDLVTIGATTTISGNAAGCSTPTELTNTCSASLTINVPAM